MSKLTGEVAIVTGASKGIGCAIAKSLAAEGASVIVNYASSKAGADAVVTAITSAGGKTVAVRGDVSKATDAKGLIDAAIKNFGRLDILVNNSGVYESPPIESFTEEQFHINIGSIVSSLTLPNSTVYTRTKGAIMLSLGFSQRSLAFVRSGLIPSTWGWLRPKADTVRASSVPTSRRR
jgi:3-oxoacyl-[acyl-carrier protein] reductase